MRRLLLTFSMVVVLGCGAGESTPSPSNSPGEATVEFSLEFDGVKDDRSFKVSVENGDTVLAAMEEARDRERIAFETEDGSGLPFVTTIDGVEGEGTGADARNWQFWINDEYATQGVGQAKLEDGDQVTWKYTTFEDAHEAN